MFQTTHPPTYGNLQTIHVNKQSLRGAHLRGAIYMEPSGNRGNLMALQRTPLRLSAPAAVMCEDLNV